MCRERESDASIGAGSSLDLVRGQHGLHLRQELLVSLSKFPLEMSGQVCFQLSLESSVLKGRNSLRELGRLGGVRNKRLSWQA